MTGIIKRLVRDKHFGFIKAPDGTEYFFHSSAVQNAAWDDLQEGQEVDDFTVSKGTKGPRAENVRVGS